ncbi:MAG: SUMF1/EgtB/PvdO family nonheme iron enzyme [Myxococcota bacterium]|nr:SUMF1/EgtB/PvdO family nonheme iron enzyme [Myxococcota bacterium]
MKPSNATQRFTLFTALCIVSVQPYFYGCTNNSFDSARSDSAVETFEDNDGDGYSGLFDEDDPSSFDCNDEDPNITPHNYRFIPEGDFIRGSELGADTQPTRDIFLSAYCISVYEVTNEEFVSFMNAQRQLGYENETTEGLPLFDFEDMDDPYPERILDSSPYTVQIGYEHHPVVEVYRWSAIAYCQSLNMRLPTEAEWEKAARGTEGALFPWGNDIATCERANYWPREPDSSGLPCVDDTQPVGSYPAGFFGLYDMAGNVSEWIHDWYQANYYDESPTENPVGPASGWSVDEMNPDGFEAGLARGGSLGSGAGSLRSFHRVAEPIDATSNGLGFRCVIPTN